MVGYDIIINRPTESSRERCQRSGAAIEAKIIDRNPELLERT